MSLLNVDEVSVRFGGIVALDNLSFAIEPGQICGLIGPNGAGKTTMFNVVSRIYQPTAGRVTFEGRNLLDVAAYDIAGVGVARTFQNLALFPTMTVLENVMVGATARSKVSWVRAALRLGAAREDAELAEQAMAILAELGLAEYALRPATGLPYGTLKRIEIARALAARPWLLLLDEPASGLTHSEVDALAGTIRQVREQHQLTVLLVEHHMQMVMNISDQVVVLNFGRKIADGTPAAVSSDPDVIEAYLGGTSLSEVMLQVSGLSAGYGPVAVLHGLDFEVNDHEVVVLLGANGAGKTTTLRALCGMIEAKGSVTFCGKELVGRPPEWTVRQGVAHVPQGRGTFPELTVLENLEAGAYVRRDRAEIRGHIDHWFGVFPRLAERRSLQAGSLSGGEQQMLAVARALMSRPKLLLLDEPSLGLAPLVTQDLFAKFTELNATFGTTMLIVEQNANLALSIAARAYVLEAGHIALSGRAEDLRDHDDVRRAYLGF